MSLRASGEDYLEAVLMLQQKHGAVRSVDLARHMGYSKPSISHAVGVLRNGGFLTVDQDGFLHLTDVGQEVAEKIYERHQFFTQWLLNAGIDLKQPSRTPAAWNMESVKNLLNGYAMRILPIKSNDWPIKRTHESTFC